MIYVVYYESDAEYQVLRAFRQLSRANDYLETLASAPFPGHTASGYRVAPVELN